jgi:ATP-binding cassette, subfamily C (CFTR/MRP), member 1
MDHHYAPVFAAEPTADRELPVAHASWWSRLTFLWLNPIFQLGYTRPLTFSDLFDLEPDLRVKPNVESFVPLWETEVERASNAHVKPSLLKALIRFLGPRYLWVGVRQWIWCIVAVVQPLIVKAMVNFVTMYGSRDDEDSGDLPPLWVGFAFSFLSLILSMLGTLCYYHGSKTAIRYGIMVRALLTDAIYRKGLQMPQHGNQVQLSSYVCLMSCPTMFQFVLNGRSLAMGRSST